MKLYLKTIFLVLLFTIIQALPIMGIFYRLGAIPNFLLVFLVIVSFKYSFKDGLKLAILIGFLIDIISHTSFINIFVFPLLYLVISNMKNDIFINPFFMLIATVIISTIIHTIFYAIFTNLFLASNFIFSLKELIIMLILNILITPLMKKFVKV